MENELSKKIVEKIKQENIQPKPKWHFLLKDWVIWIVGGLAFVGGGIIFAVILYFYTTHDFELYHLMEESSVAIYLKTVPYIWVLLLALFVFLADYQLRHTKDGYKYSLWKLFGVGMGASVVLGIGFYFIGANEIIEEQLEHEPLWLLEYTRPAMHSMGQPEEGLLVGKVLEVKSFAQENIEGFDDEDYDDLPEELLDEEYSELLLKDPHNDIWKVMYYQEEQERGLHENMHIRVIGDIIGENEFEAELIRPFKNRPRDMRPELQEKIKKKFKGQMRPVHHKSLKLQDKLESERK